MAKMRLANGSQSDQVTLLMALEGYDQAARRGGGGTTYRYCTENFLSSSTTNMIADLRKNLQKELHGLGFPNIAQKGSHSRNEMTGDQSLWESLVQSVLVAGLYPNLATRVCGDVNFSTAYNRKAKVHVSSVNSLRGMPLSCKCELKKGTFEGQEGKRRR